MMGFRTWSLVGRSNVGKSTLLNALTRVQVARTSAAPGKTRLANIYQVAVEGGPGGPGRWSFYFADLPGYGYARGGRESVDRADPDRATRISAGDHAHRAASSISSTPGTPGSTRISTRRSGCSRSTSSAAIVATKIDKLTRNERAKNLKALERQLGMAALPISATGGEGLDELWTLIARLSRR